MLRHSTATSLHWLIFTVISAAALTGCATSPPPPQAPAGFTTLFNGCSLQGWHGLAGDPTARPDPTTRPDPGAGRSNLLAPHRSGDSGHSTTDGAGGV